MCFKCFSKYLTLTLMVYTSINFQIWQARELERILPIKQDSRVEHVFICYEPVTSPSRAVLVTRRTAWALNGESFDWQKSSQDKLDSSDKMVESWTWDFSYADCNSNSRARAASRDSGSRSLSWDAPISISLSIPNVLIPSTPCKDPHRENSDATTRQLRIAG